MNYPERSVQYLQSLCMIPGSMGVWETYFVQLTSLWEELPEEIQAEHIIYAADNGIVKEGHIGFSADITRLHSKNMLQGGAAVTALCHYNNIPYTLVDAGIISDEPIGYSIKAACGTQNFLNAPAMTQDKFQFVWTKAQELIKEKSANGVHLISFGEMGIGNTTTSAAVLSGLTGAKASQTVGPGSGADEQTLKKKISLVDQGIELHKESMTSPQDILRCVGGFDLVALTASMLACMEMKTPYIIDGFITATAHACAFAINPDVAKYVVPSHMSREPGMKIALDFAGIDVDTVPLHAAMALGEGTGSVLMTQLLRTLCHTFKHMTTLESVLTETFTTKEL